MKVVEGIMGHLFYVGRKFKWMIVWEKSNEDENCFFEVFGAFEGLNGEICQRSKKKKVLKCEATHFSFLGILKFS